MPCAAAPPRAPIKAPFEMVLDEIRRDYASPERLKLADDYAKLMRLYEDYIEIIYEGTDEACCRILSESRIPDLSEIDLQHYEYYRGTANQEDPLTRSVKRTFFEAMESLQNSQLPKKHRGNLPKEAVAVFKRWFDEHSDHPYPADEVKIALSNKTGVELNQITNWFINHRKRVWKPQLPDNHPLKGTASRR